MERYSEYKDSGVQWLGEIPGHWKRVNLRKLCSLKTGTTPKFYENPITGNVIDWYTPSDFREKIFLGESSRKLNQLDVDNTGLTLIPAMSVLIIGIGGTAGKVACCTNECYSNQQITSLIPNDKVEPLYLTFFLRCKRQELLNTAHFTTLPILNNQFLSGLFIPLPPLSEQRAIVSYLDSKCEKIDKMIEGKEKQIALLEELKQRTIADAVMRGLNPDVKMKTTNISWLEEIPEHWITRRLGSLFTGDVETNKDFEFKRAFKFNYGQLVAKNEVGDPEEYHDVYVKYSKVRLGDILVNGLNLNYDFVSQRVACAPSEGIITSAYIVCRPREGVNYEYYTFLLKSMDNMKLFHGMGTGIRLTLSYKEIKKQIVPVPPLSEQRAIVSYINERTEKINTLTSKLQQEIESIKEYKQRLICDVVTGQIKVC